MSKLVIVSLIIWQIISSQNNEVTKTNENETNSKICNCRNKSKYPGDNKYLTKKDVFKAEVKPNDVA